MNNNFFTILDGLKDERKHETVKFILSRFKEQSAVDPKFYQSPNKLKKCMNDLFSKVRTTDKFLEALIRIEAQTPYSIFGYILNEDFSDIMFYGDGYNLTDNGKEEKVKIPDNLLIIYNIFLEHFIENIVFLAGKKFDTANGILDTEINKLRFNMIHKKLNNNEYTVIVIRKQTINNNPIFQSGNYLSQIGATEKQIDAIQKFALHGNTIIFGEVGSGKTTMLRYMGNYKLDEKRNLCTIEDTKELGISVPISLLTNHHFKIKDLFTASLRQNPSHVLIGETRTDEIVDILESALTTNVATTIHANSFLRAIQRIVFMSMSRQIDPNQILNLINASVDCFIFMERRKIKEIWIHKNEYIPNVYEAYEKIN